MTMYLFTTAALVSGALATWSLMRRLVAVEERAEQNERDIQSIRQWLDKHCDDEEQP